VLKLDHAGIAALIPHAGAMCLLHGVVDWDAERITCLARGQTDARNPLRVGDTLPALCGIEYAAQAMAVHGGLTALEGRRPRAGYLASLRDVRSTRARLDDLDELTIEATRVMGDANNVIYEFKLHASDAPVLSGRATVILDIGAAAPQGSRGEPP
jgi:predicted hotdog family 3-hydroxylacyl-ACP dehydratase